MKIIATKICSKCGPLIRHFVLYFVLVMPHILIYAREEMFVKLAVLIVSLPWLSR